MIAPGWKFSLMALPGEMAWKEIDIEIERWGDDRERDIGMPKALTMRTNPGLLTIRPDGRVSTLVVYSKLAVPPAEPIKRPVRVVTSPIRFTVHLSTFWHLTQQLKSMPDCRCANKRGSRKTQSGVRT